jgi:hypothetical protein
MVDFMNKMYGFDPSFKPIWKTCKPITKPGEAD